MMSQQSVLSYFKSVKRSNPDQHAAKKRKVILQSHEIESLLDTEHDHSRSGDEADAEEDNQSPKVSVLDKESDVSTDAFEDDSDWENVANTTLDDVEKESEKGLQFTEVAVGVTTWAGDNHRPVEAVVKTPTTIKMSEAVNNKMGKTAEREAKWTPTSASEPLFTMGYVDLVPSSAKKRLNWSEPEKKTKRNVVFKKMSKLSRWKVASPKKLSYCSLDIKLTPQKVMSLPPEPINVKESNAKRMPSYAGVMKNLFSEPPVIKKSEQILPDLKPTISNAKRMPSCAGVTKNLFSEPRVTKPSEQTLPDLKPAISNAKKLVEKKITPDQIKSRLGNAKLQDLRSLLSGIEGSKLKADTARKRPSPVKTLKPDIALELDIASTPHQSPVKIVKTPVKASPRKLPAYQRYHTLSQPVNRSLPLPLTYSRLLEVFRSTDTVVSMMFNKRERITLATLAKNTTDIMNKKWTVEHLRKMICVFPQSYKLNWRSNRMRPDIMELVVEPNMNYKRDLMRMFDETQPGDKQMTAAILVERRDMFRNGLVDIVKDYHEEFLASLEPPITADRTKLTRWHKDFNVDVLPDIDQASLPAHPDAPEVQGPDLAEKAEYFKENSKLSDVLLDINKTNNDHTYPAPSPSKILFSPQKSHASPMKSGLEGLNPSLIAKIRAKEAAKAKLEMTRSEEKLEKIATLRKLPRLARLVK